MRVSLTLPDGAGLLDGAETGMRRAMEHLKGVSNQEAPLDEGTMVRNSYVTVESDGDVVRGTLVYIGPQVVRQHEELTWRHLPGRKAKFVEDPMHSEGPVMGDLIAAGIRGVA